MKESALAEICSELIPDAVSAVAEIPHDVAFRGDLKARAIEAVEKELNHMWRHRFVHASELTPEQRKTALKCRFSIT